MKSEFEAAWRRRFEEFGLENDDEAGIAGWSETGLRARLRNFERSWKPHCPGALWLDAGCGAGSYTRVMVASEQQVIALDYSLPTLSKAQQHLHGLAILWVAGDVTDLPLRSASCDGAICFGVLQALSSPTQAITELARVVRPGGKIWVDALNALCLPNLASRLLTKARGQEGRLRYDSPYRLRRVLLERGFRDIRVIWVPILPRRFHAAQRVLESSAVRALFEVFPWLGSAVSHAYVVAASR